jgi:CDP-paratose 2-epimerase
MGRFPISGGSITRAEALRARDATEEAGNREASQFFPGASLKGISEDFPLDGPRSLYGATKLCSELMLQEYQDMYGVKAVINRCGVLAGPWQMGKVDQGVVVLWVARHIYGGRLDYVGFGGRGKQVRDMLHIKDLLQLILYEISHLDDLTGKVFNVGGGLDVSASLLELTELCRRVTGNSIEIGGVPENRPADIRLYITDNARVTECTGWRPARDLQTILEDIHKWITDNREALKPVLA